MARADTLSTVIEGLYDPDADARGTPSVHWFLGYDADGAPQFCGLPAHHTCPHRMDCPHCGLFIGGERARLIHDDPSLLPVTAEVSTPRHDLAGSPDDLVKQSTCEWGSHVRDEGAGLGT